MSRPEVTLYLPWPPAVLHPNARGHWAKKARATREYREQVGWIARAECHGTALTPPVVAQTTFLVPDRRRRDIDNLMASLKAAFDGMVDGGALVGDHGAVLRHEAPVLEYVIACDKSVVVTLKELT